MAKKPAPPHLAVLYDDYDIRAFNALASGVASDTQQRRVLDFIVNKAARYYDLSFQDGPDGDRATSFMEGRRFVGAQVVKLTKLVPEPAK